MGGRQAYDREAAHFVGGGGTKPGGPQAGLTLRRLSFRKILMARVGRPLFVVRLVDLSPWLGTIHGRGQAA